MRTCPACSTPFRSVGRQRFCSDNCRKTAYRRRRQPLSVDPFQIPSHRPRRDVTVYECPGCESRYVGQQRCDDCGVFCRRIGYGGPCPHCDEPVAIIELTGPHS